MPDDNKRNLLYFESDSMRGLYGAMEEWQRTSGRRLLSTDVQRDGERFCCIALSNPSEVVICTGFDDSQATVTGGRLFTSG